MNHNIKVEIINIAVDSRYYSFNYKIWLDGELKKDSSYSDSHSRRDDVDVFRKELHDEYALMVAIENMY